MELLRCLIEGKEQPVESFCKHMEDMYDITVSDEVRMSVINNLNLSFLKNQEKAALGIAFIDKCGSSWNVSSEFNSMLKNEEFKSQLNDIINFGISRYIDNYFERYKDSNLKLYQKYTYEDVCRLLNWDKNMNALNIGGYFYDSKTKTMPVFINYEKSEDAINYEDRFLSSKELIALSKHPRRITSSDADHIYKRTKEDEENKIYLFVRKNKDDKEAKEFYFLGEIEAVGEPQEVIMKKYNDEAFEINYILDRPIREDIYEYIVGE